MKCWGHMKCMLFNHHLHVVVAKSDIQNQWLGITWVQTLYYNHGSLSLCWFMRCAIKSELIYSVPNRVFKASDIFQSGFTSAILPNEFLWSSGDLNPGLPTPSPSLYPLCHTGLGKPVYGSLPYRQYHLAKFCDHQMTFSHSPEDRRTFMAFMFLFQCHRWNDKIQSGCRLLDMLS